MPTDRERTKRFRAARTAQARRRTAIQRDTAKEVRRLLAVALDRIRAELAAAPSDFQAFHLTNLQQSVRLALEEMERQASARLGRGAGEAWQAGIELIDEPIEAGGLRISGLLPEVDTRQLMAMRAFMTDRMRDISTTAANRVNGELGLVAIGSQTQSQAAAAIGEIIAGGRSRAITIIRTELGRAYSVAGQERQAQARAYLPGLRKQWRRSGKIHSRPAHDAIDGQVRDVDEPFDVGGEQLRFPRDPRGSAENTINCGCESLPWMESWEVREPGRRPFSKQELALSPRKRDLESGL